MPKTVYDVAVIGAGPAGAAAAITAARSGSSVLLLEKGSFPRQRVCGEFVSPESLALLSGLLSREHHALLDGAIRISHARIFLDGSQLSVPVEPAAASIARYDLDLVLWNSARNAQVSTIQATVQRITRNGSFRIEGSNSEFHARAVINASGRWSNLTADSALPPQQTARWIGIKAHFVESSPPPSVDLYFFDGGYCGVQPVQLYDGQKRSPESINVSAMVRADVATTLPEVFAQHPALQARSANWEAFSSPVTTAPLIFRELQTGDDGILRAGDAAVFVDPFVGDGISLALRSGTLAAQTLMPFFAGKIGLEQAVSSYGAAYEKSLAPIFRASSTIRRMLRLSRPVRAPLFYILGKTPAMTRWMVRKTR